MSKEIKNILIFPFVAITSTIGFLTAMKTITENFTNIRDKLIIILLVVIASLLFITFCFYKLIIRHKKHALELEDNNKGLIQAKKTYLEENVELKNYLNEIMAINGNLNNKNVYLTKLIKDILVQHQLGNTNIENQNMEMVIDFIIEEDINEQKYLESNKNN